MNLLARMVIKITNAHYYSQDDYWNPRRFNKNRWAVTMGDVIIAVRPSEITLMHERGHVRQYRMYGWKYWFIVGIPSVARNIWDRFAHRKWSSLKRRIWYYSGWPEKEADRLEGVIRW